ncbi:MAG: MerR family transcriptional regulator [Proteobacteria bacterium]|nr:MerR family transcriptional regulator [Pseudomonadota bacterium]
MNTLKARDDDPLLFPELEEFFRPQTKTTSKETNMNEEHYKTISEVANDFDIAASVIRYWETKFKTLSPLKRNGRRYFSIEQQELISSIKDLLYVQGYTIKAAQDLIVKNDKSKKLDSPKQEQNNNKQPKNEEFINSIVDRLEAIKGILR